jgi:hypothetical protein
VEIQKAVADFLIATLPVAFLYFMGWGYLYFYFGAFGIDISETTLDTSTVFIYAFSPISVIFKHYRIWLGPTILIIAPAVFLVAVLSPLVSHDVKKWIRDRLRWIMDLPLAAQLVVAAVAFVIVLWAFIPVLQWAAMQHVSKVWKGEAETVIPLLADKGKSDEKTTLASRRFIDSTSKLRESYVNCSFQKAFLLIFSDDKAYYLLCRGLENSTDGIVFEVRRDNGLTSARFVTSGE